MHRSTRKVSLSLEGAEFPHDIETQDLVRGDEFVYRIQCNWKVFFENAIDGYHLAYLHEHTLGGPKPELNEWVNHGKHMVWYSTERDDVRNRIPKFVEDQAAQASIATIPGADAAGYGGVYMLYPTTLITPSPWSLPISTMQPVDASDGGYTVCKRDCNVTDCSFYQDLFRVIFISCGTHNTTERC